MLELAIDSDFALKAWYYYQRHSKNDYLAIRLLVSSLLATANCVPYGLHTQVAFVLICDTVQQALLCGTFTALLQQKMTFSGRYSCCV